MHSMSGHDQRQRQHAHRPVLQFSLETASDSLNDLDLRIVPLTESSSSTHGGQQSASTPTAGPSSARWVRRRVLTGRDEIVDQIVDVHTGRLCWSAHRPTRGWYLHLRSPALPANVALTLQPPPRNRAIEAGSTPLMLTVNTQVQAAALSDLVSTIGSDDIDALATTATHSNGHGRTASHMFTSVNLDTTHAYPPVQITNSDGQLGAVRTTGVESATASKGHARRRSAGTSISHPTKRSISQPSQTPAVPEEGALPRQSATSTMEEQPRKSSTGKVNIKSNAALISSNSDLAGPRSCSFILSDGECPPLGSNNASVTGCQVTHKGGWARWAWNLVPAPVRPSLRLDGSKSFSIYWVDVPVLEQSALQATKEVEVLRFDDESSWLHWKSKRIGRILLQHRAVEALNLDVAMWIAVRRDTFDCHLPC